MNTFTQDDLVYLLKQDKKLLNKIVAGMTAILIDPESKCETLMTQNWVKRMFASVLGVKKANAEIIQKNSSAMCAYCAEAIAALFDNEKISEAMIRNLGEQVKELYATHYELRYILGAFSKKLDEKIRGMDRFYTLCKEIELDRFGSDGNMFWLFRTMAEVDDGMLRDERKMELLNDLLYEKEIVTKEQISAEIYLFQMLAMPEEHAGIVYLEMLNYSGDITADLAMAAIERWHMQTRSNKQYFDKAKIVGKITEDFGIDTGDTISPEIVYEAMIETKKISVAKTLDASIEKTVSDTERDIRQKERQQEIQANVQRNVEELKTNTKELASKASTNMKKGMRSLKGFLGKTKDNVVSLARKSKESESI